MSSSTPFQFNGIDLPSDLLEIAEQELGETVHVRSRSIVEFRLLLSELPEDKKPNMEKFTDAYILRFLRARKFRVKQAFDICMNLYNFEVENPQYFNNLNGEEFIPLYKLGFQRVLTGKDIKGRRISCLLPAKMTAINAFTSEEAEKFPDMMMRWSVWCFERMSRCPYFQVNGMVIIENFADFSMMDNMRMSFMLPFSLMRKMFHFAQSCIAYRLGGIRVWNQPFYMNAIWAIVRPFMQEKMVRRVAFYGEDWDKLTTEVVESLDVLPAEFHGTLDEDPMQWLLNEIELEKKGL